MLAAALFLLAASQAPPSIELYRGAPLAGEPFGYWDVTDTYLDGQNPTASFGGNGVLLGGPNRVVLVRFGDLARALRSTGGRGIKQARLVLTPSGGGVPQLKSVSRVLVSWGEGPSLTLGTLIGAQPAKPGEAPPKPVAPVGAATWSARHSGSATPTRPSIPWGAPGASGGEDVRPIFGAAMQPGEQAVEITGLTEAVREMARRGYENFGFALSFTSPCEFFSSQSPTGRPRLVLELEGPPPAPANGPDLSVVSIERRDAEFVATIKNRGNAAAPGMRATWSVGYRTGATETLAEPLPPGQQKTVTLSRTPTFDASDHRHQPVSLRVATNGDTNPANDALEVQESARQIQVVVEPGHEGIEDRIQEQVRLFNEVMAPQSRFSFAPDGALERLSVTIATTATSPTALAWAGDVKPGTDPGFLRALLRAAGAPDLSLSNVTSRDRNPIGRRASSDLYPGLLGYGDTRFEGHVPNALNLLYEPFASPLFDAQSLEPTGMLSATEVGVLNAMLDGKTTTAQALQRLPGTIVFRATDLLGRALPNTELSFFQSSNGRFTEDPPVFSAVTDARGTVVLPAREGGLFGPLQPRGGNATFLIRANAYGVTEWGWMKLWQLYDGRQRSGIEAAVHEVRFNLPGAPLEAGTDLALDKIVTDSRQSQPAQLAALIDQNPTTSVELGAKAGDWIEIDLGRDRTIGEISLTAEPGAMWAKFDILVYATGQSPSAATIWAKETNWPWVAANRGEVKDGLVEVPYRGAPLRVRAIRLVNRTGSAGRLSNLRIVPARLAVPLLN